MDQLMKQDDNFYYWKKGESVKFNRFFKTNEFDCNCNYPECKEQKISKSLIEKLYSMRVETKKPININSGFRCAKYQQHLRDIQVSTVVAKSTSTHELGTAADPSCPSMPISDFLKIAEKHFTSIGLAATFLHVDERPDYRRWRY
jgi:uncharacterized protein YcbK (DUF882 family)